jgi:hypothetical protein
MPENWYQIPLTERLQLLQQEGFKRNELRVWSHTDGRVLGESVVAALTDESFLRYLSPEIVAEAEEDLQTKTGSSH